MSALPTFADFLLSTKVVKITGLKEILNEAVKHTYLISEMLRGRDETAGKILQGGSSIKDDIQLSNAGSFRFYNPHAELAPRDSDILKEISVGWRFSVTSYAFSDEVVSLNEEADMEDRYVSLKAKYEQGCKTDQMNGMEDAIWAVPVPGGMESGTGDDPPAYSIPCFINEATNGLWPSFTTGNGGPNTLMGLNPSTESRWRPQQTSYDSTNPLDDGVGLIAAFDDMWNKVRYKPPEAGSRYFEDDKARRRRILTNNNGQKLYKRALRAANDLTRQGPQDPAYNEPVYSGIPVEYIDTLDTAALEITGQTTATGNAWPTTKPRFLWPNLEYLFPIWHKRGYMEQVGPVAGGINQPFSHAVYYRTWYNLFNRSRQRMGIVYPA